MVEVAEPFGEARRMTQVVGNFLGRQFAGDRLDEARRRPAGRARPRWDGISVVLGDQLCGRCPGCNFDRRSDLDLDRRSGLTQRGRRGLRLAFAADRPRPGRFVVEREALDAGRRDVDDAIGGAQLQPFDMLASAPA